MRLRSLRPGAVTGSLRSAEPAGVGGEPVRGVGVAGVPLPLAGVGADVPGSLTRPVCGVELGELSDPLDRAVPGRW